MNLHGVASSVVSAVNPLMPVTCQISTGSTTNADGTRSPAYATPGAFTGSITGNLLTVSAQSAGTLQVGQTISGAGLPSGLVISALGTLANTYVLNQSGLSIGSEAMTAALNLQAQIQPVTWKDIQQLEGLNISGIRWKAYLYGQVNGIVRAEKKGGDLIVVPAGPHAGTWLVAEILESWPDWVLAAITLQNGE